MTLYAILIRLYATAVEAVLLDENGTYLGAATADDRATVTLRLLEDAATAGTIPPDTYPEDTTWVEAWADAPEQVRTGYAAAVTR